MFQVNGQTWLIRFVRPSSGRLRRSDGSRTVAVTDNNDKTIYIADTVKGEFLDRVICHELTHVYSFENNLIIPIETEEVIADFMSRFGRSVIYLADEIMNNLLRRTA